MHLIEAVNGTSPHHLSPQLWCSVCVRGDDAEHGGHVGVDHSRALGYAAHPYLHPSNLRLRRYVKYLLLGAAVFDDAEHGEHVGVKVPKPLALLPTLTFTLPLFICMHVDVVVSKASSESLQGEGMAPNLATHATMWAASNLAPVRHMPRSTSIRHCCFCN